MPDIATPPNVMDALNKANDIANGIGWPPVWRYPSSSQGDDVWNALGPVRDNVEKVSGKTLDRPENASPGELVAVGRHGILNSGLRVGAHQPGAKE